MSQLRILHVITALETGGAETFLCRLLSRLPRERFKSLVASMVRPGFQGGRIRNLGIPLANLGLRRGRPSIGGIRRLMGLIQDFRPDLVQTWLHHADLLGLAAVRLSVDVPLVWNLRNAALDPGHAPLLTRATAWACARLSGLPEAVIANSEAVRDQHLARGYHPREFALIQNGVDADEFRPDPAARAAVRKELGLSEDTPLAGLLARFDPLKDHAGFFQAAAVAAKALPQARFLLCGLNITQVNRPLMALARQAGVQDRVILAGHRQDPARVLAALDVCCSSSLSEGFPNTLAEAMSCGVPCAATDAGGTAEVLGDCGRLAPARDPEALGRAMVQLLALAPEERAALGNRCQERIRERFSLEASARAYAGLYERLISRQ